MALKLWLSAGAFVALTTHLVLEVLGHFAKNFHAVELVVIFPTCFE
jgi:hypothetical protein